MLWQISQKMKQILKDNIFLIHPQVPVGKEKSKEVMKIRAKPNKISLMKKLILDLTQELILDTMRKLKVDQSKLQRNQLLEDQ